MAATNIIELIRTGHSDKAFAALYKHYPMIRKMIRKYGGSRHDAEDIFHESLIIFHRQAANPDFTLTAQPGTYLYSVSRFLWNDERKRRQKLPIQNEPEAEFESSLQTSHEDEEQYRLAEKAIASLTEHCQQILRFFYLERSSLRDIAAQMGLTSENAAKTQKYKCLEGARTILRDLKKSLQTL